MLESPSLITTNGDYFNSEQNISSPTDVFIPAVTTRRAWKVQQQAEYGIHLNAPFPDSAASSPSCSSESIVTKKRKEPHHPSDPPPKPKKSRSPPLIQVHKPVALVPPIKSKKRAASSLPSSRQSSRPPTIASSPEPTFDSGRSRSVSVVPLMESRIARRCWIEEDGTPGSGFISNEIVIKSLISKGKDYYKGFFKNLDDPNDKSFEPENLPTIELEYPNSHAVETFLLLAPRDKDHYHPVMCLEASLYTVVEFYVTPAQQVLFGSIPTASLSDITRDKSPSPLSSPSKSSSDDELPPLTSSPLTSISSRSSPCSPKINYLRQIQRAIHRQDGPLFVSTMHIINQLLRDLKYPPLPIDPFDDQPKNELTKIVTSWTCVPKKVRERMIEETYQRCVGPSALALEKSYKPGSNEVYGELLPNLTSEIINITGLGPESLFLDLGSGVGNIVLQASVETGCRSYGIEIGSMPADLASIQLEQMKKRCRMWGFSMGDVELEHGDMLKSERLSQLMREADVVLINNKVFNACLNEAVRASFLDLKEGAIVVSLATFWDPKNITERNVNDMSAIFQVTAHPYRSGNVSWGNGGGYYYVHRVDREGYSKIQQRIELSSRSSSRASYRPRRQDR